MSDQLIIIPEYVLLKTVQNLLTFIRKNYNDATDKDKSYLRRLLKNNGLERYDLIKQAEAVFIQEEDHPRFLEADLMYNMHKEGAPSIHITLPAEMSSANGMGMDEGYKKPIEEANGFTSVFTRRYQSTYNVVITSDNSNEVTLIYHVLRALITSALPSLHVSGLEGARLGGQDVLIKTDLMPKLFIKAISISLEYETSAPNLFTDPVFHSLVVTGKLVDK